MAIVFDSTVGGASANSYASVTEYAQYRENLGLSVLTTSAAQIQLIRATSWLDNQYRNRWNTMTLAASTQALHWPQSNAKDAYGTAIASTVIPAQVKQAVYEYAIRVESASQTSLDPAVQTNVKMQSLDGLGSQEFWGRKSDGSLPDDFAFIDTILYGLISSRSGGLQFLDLQRAG